jgi:membrane protease YdiL (CAAX protease family)
MKSAFAEALPPGDTSLADAARDMESNVEGSVGQRQRWAIMLAELGGPEFAVRTLAETDELLAERDRKLAGDQERAQTLLHRLYAPQESPEDPDAHPAPPPADDLTDGERALLAQELGWLGKLAANPEGGADPDVRRELLRPAERGFWIGSVALGGLCLALLAGALAGVLFVVLAATRKVRMHFVPGTAPHGVYMEPFATWFTSFLVPQVGASAAAPERFELAAVGLAFFVSLAALAWPVRRGIPWETVRRDLGLHTGRWGLMETASGLAAYLMTLPLLMLGALVVVVLLQFQNVFSSPGDPLDPVGGAAHPIVGELMDGDLLVRISVVFAAVVAAPIVEEIAFRGLLYRHLRDASAGWGRALSALASAAFNGFLFAAVHPQGWVAIPALGAIGFGLCIAREWRDSIVPPIVLHAVSNGIVVTVALSVFGS